MEAVAAGGAGGALATVNDLRAAAQGPGGGGGGVHLKERVFRGREAADVAGLALGVRDEGRVVAGPAALAAASASWRGVAGAQYNELMEGLTEARLEELRLMQQGAEPGAAGRRA